MNTATVAYPVTPLQSNDKVIHATSSFKLEVFKVLGAIILFVLVYLTLMAAATLLALLCGYGGFMLIVGYPRFITIAIGVGLIGLGCMVVFFLLKFLFKRNKVDRSHLIEVNESEQPDLFSFIRRLTKDTASPFPKKIYISAEVNASVFYDSSFWSMFLPVRKNLVIGLGLVNSVNLSEFKAILAHEFGHFSQRSMKLGSYTYNVNQVIYNLLYDNEGYGKILDSWANVNGYFAFFAGITIKIVQGIQWILQKMYSFVNKSYMRLSREMEFHADSVAAMVSGSDHLITSLRRLEVADNCYNRLFEYYNLWFKENLRPTNIYPQHKEMMKQFAVDHNLRMADGLPQIDAESFAYFNRTRVIIKDQWASHPSTDDREDNLNKLGIKAEILRNSPWLLFRNSTDLQKFVTDKIFNSVTFQGTPVEVDDSHFLELYKNEINKYNLSDAYKGFYNTRNISLFDVDQASEEQSSKNLDTILNAEALSLPYIFDGIKIDISTLESIQNGSFPVKTFEFDGKKYKKKNTKEILIQLQAELKSIQSKLENIDKEIFFSFVRKADPGHQQELKDKYKMLFRVTKESEDDMSMYAELMNTLSPIYYGNLSLTDVEVIMAKVKNIEVDVKKRIEDIIRANNTMSFLKENDVKKLNDYASKEHIYFTNGEFQNDSLTQFNEAMNAFHTLAFDRSFQLKKDLLEFQLR